MTVRETADQYLANLAAEQRSPHTVAAYRRDLRAFTTFTGDMDLAAVTPDLLQRFIGSPGVQLDATGRHRAKATINRYRVTLKALFAWSEARWLVPRNPTAILRCQRHRVLPPAVLTEAEIEQVLSFDFVGRHAARDHALLTFMILTGCRLAETVGLDVGNIDARGKVAIIKAAKGGEPERVLLSERALAVLAPLITRAAEAPLFTAGGRRISTRQVQRIVQRRLREAGIDKELSPHSLRHTFATRLYNQTGDIRLVQVAMRHQHVATTEYYAQVDPLRWREVINAGAGRGA
jgi:integrase/recombinase XerC